MANFLVKTVALWSRMPKKERLFSSGVALVLICVWEQWTFMDALFVLGCVLALWGFVATLVDMW